MFSMEFKKHYYVIMDLAPQLNLNHPNIKFYLALLQ